MKRRVATQNHQSRNSVVAHALPGSEQEPPGLALMDHPNIAKVFDAGIAGEIEESTPRVPYFVMELVRAFPSLSIATRLLIQLGATSRPVHSRSVRCCAACTIKKGSSTAI